MDLHPTPFPGKTQQHLKSRNNKISSEAHRANATKEQPIQRQKRVFGTSRNPNADVKAAPGKAMIKPSTYGVAQKPTKTTSSSTKAEAVQEIGTAKNASNEKNARPKKKSVCFQEKVVCAQGQTNSDDRVSRQIKVSESVTACKKENTGHQTPVKSPALVKPRVSVTPYLSAERCSKCRFDKLENSSYWLAQIKLAESVQKHFASAAFFRLALQSKAEPFRNIRIELKRYLARHEQLCSDDEWRDVSTKYGLMKYDNDGEAKLNEEEEEEEEEIDKEESKHQIAEQIDYYNTC